MSKGPSPLPPEALLALLPSILSQVQADQMAARRFLRLELYLLGAMADKVLGEEELNRLMAAAGVNFEDIASLDGAGAVGAVADMVSALAAGAKR